MKPERLEQLLRTQPPDEPTYRGELLIGPRVARPTHAQFTGGRTRAGALGAMAVGVVVVGIAILAVGGPLASRSTVGPSTSPAPSQTAGPSTSAQALVPWIDATPAPSPTPEPSPDPRSYPTCTAGDLVLQAEGWGGATGSLAGGASVLNLTANPCTVTGRPSVALLDARGEVIAPATAPSAVDPGAAPVVLPSGGVAGVIIVWGNWCGAPPKLPLSVRLSLPDQGGTLTATVGQAPVSPAGVVPRCDSPGDGSSLGVPLSFSAPEPSSGGYQPDTCAVDGLAAYLGAWGGAAGSSYTRLVVSNTGSFDCLLDRAPTFELRDANGRRLVVAQSDLPPASASILLPAGWAAVATIGFSDWCTADPQTPLHADLLIASRRLAIDARSPIPVPACMAAPATPPPALFYYIPFATPGSPTAPEPDAADSLPVSVAISVLPPAAPGEALEYTVTLTNTDAYEKSISLEALCPTYTERLILPGAAGTIETHHALNCVPVAALEPGTPVSFAMRLPIPADAPPGAATLVWQLGARGPAVKATFQIRPN